MSKEEITNAKPHIVELLRSTGRDPDQGNMTCLWHSPDNHPSMSYIPSSYRVYCHACHQGGDIIDVYAAIHGLDPKSREAINGAIAFAGTATPQPLFNAAPKNNAPTVDLAPIRQMIHYAANHLNHDRCIDYLARRGFSAPDRDILKTLNVGFDPIHNDLIIPHGDSYYTARFIYSTSKADRFRRNPSAPVQLFNPDALNNPFVGVTEGAIDALSLIVCGLPSVAIGGSGTHRKLVDALADMPAKPFIFIAFDNDDSGRTAASALALKLATIGVHSRAIIPNNKHDYNEILQTNRGKLEQFIESLPSMTVSKGAISDGVASDGVASDGAISDGAASDGAISDGAVFDGAVFDGAVSKGAVFDGAVSKGAVFDEKDDTDAPVSPPPPAPPAPPAPPDDPEPPILLNNRATTDADLAEQIIHGYAKGKVLYSLDSGKFLVYKAPRWFELPKDADLRTIIRDYRLYLQRELPPGYGDVIGNLTSEKKIAKVVSHFHSYKELWIRNNDLNPDNMLLNCRNGVLDLRTGELIGHSPSQLMTQIADVDFDPNARSEVFDRFIETTINDAETRHALQIFLGYCITGDISEEKALFVVGKGGNGKGTLFRSLLNMLGEYGTPLKIDAVLAAHRTQDANAASPEFNKLEFRRLAVAEEMPAHRQLDAAQFKLLTGGDYLPVRKLHQEARIIKHVTHKLILSGNSLPELSNADDDGLKRRLLVLEFKNSFDEAQRDTKLKQKLSTPEARSAILNWLLDGCLQWQERGLLSSKEMNADRELYLLSQDHLGDFIADYCVLDPDKQCPRKDFIAAVRQHGDYEARNMTDKEITNYLITKEEIVVKRTNRGRVFVGIALIDADHS